MKIARRLAWLVVGATLAACAPSGDVSTQNEPTEDELSSIKPSTGVQQAIANCWVFATTAWMEALSARPEGGVARDLSEAYVSYFWWFEQITKGPIWEWGGTGRSVDPTGWWGIAVELMRRYGWMEEQAFLSLRSPAEYASRHQRALNAIRQALWSGELKNDAARTDRALVVRVLNRAWELAPEVTRDLATAFGTGYERTLLSKETRVAGTRLHRLSEIPVGYTASLGTEAVTLADLVGEPMPGTPIFRGKRVGPLAFSDVEPPDNDLAMRGYLRRAQKALNQDVPVVVAEYSDDAQIDATGTYQKPASGKLGSAYAHVVMVFDLAVQTKEFGLLPAGTPETRADALQASLLDEAQPLTFRARNSYWGQYAAGTTVTFAGSTATHDFSIDYLLMPYVSRHGRRVMLWTTLANDPDLVLLKTSRR